MGHLGADLGPPAGFCFANPGIPLPQGLENSEHTCLLAHKTSCLNWRYFGENVKFLIRHYKNQSNNVEMDMKRWYALH